MARVQSMTSDILVAIGGVRRRECRRRCAEGLAATVSAGNRPIRPGVATTIEARRRPAPPVRAATRLSLFQRAGSSRPAIDALTRGGRATARQKRPRPRSGDRFRGNETGRYKRRTSTDVRQTNRLQETHCYKRRRPRAAGKEPTRSIRSCAASKAAPRCGEGGGRDRVCMIVDSSTPLATPSPTRRSASSSTGCSWIRATRCSSA